MSNTETGGFNYTPIIILVCIIFTGLLLFGVSFTFYNAWKLNEQTNINNMGIEYGHGKICGLKKAQEIISPEDKYPQDCKDMDAKYGYPS